MLTESLAEQHVWYLRQAADGFDTAPSSTTAPSPVLPSPPSGTHLRRHGWASRLLLQRDPHHAARYDPRRPDLAYRPDHPAPVTTQGGGNPRIAADAIRQPLDRVPSSTGRPSSPRRPGRTALGGRLRVRSQGQGTARTGALSLTSAADRRRRLGANGSDEIAVTSHVGPPAPARGRTGSAIPTYGADGNQAHLG